MLYPLVEEFAWRIQSRPGRPDETPDRRALLRFWPPSIKVSFSQTISVLVEQ